MYKYISLITIALLLSVPSGTLEAGLLSSDKDPKPDPEPAEVEEVQEGEIDDDSRTIPLPVLGVSLSTITDSYGDARSGGRIHEGIDIAANRGSLVLSPVTGVVTGIGWEENGGNHVYVTTSENDLYYFAHLDKQSPYLKQGDEVSPGSWLGTVGNSGNAYSTYPHLHFGIYLDQNIPTNPFPKIDRELNSIEILTFVEELLDFIS